jgi:hypothetical protein
MTARIQNEEVRVESSVVTRDEREETEKGGMKRGKKRTKKRVKNEM